MHESSVFLISIFSKFISAVMLFIEFVASFDISTIIKYLFFIFTNKNGVIIQYNDCKIR